MFIEHVAIWSSNIENSKDFYTKYFGAISNEKYISKNNIGFESYFLKFQNSSRLEIMQHPDIKQNINADKIGFTHIAFALKSKEDVDSLCKKFEEDKIKIISYPRITGDGYYEACILDIDGNKIEITTKNY